MKKKPSGFDKLAKQIGNVSKKIDGVTDLLSKFVTATKEDFDDVKTDAEKIERKVDEGFSRVERRLDGTVQPQLDEHARRIKKIETKVLS